MSGLKHITIDFESRSECPITLGAAKYSEHPSTEVKMMCWGFKDEPVQDWLSPVLEPYGITPSPRPERLFQLIAEGALVEAHNAFFERMMWRNIMVKKYGWPDIPDAQWRCSAAKAAACSLPRGLGKVAEIMGTKVQKDKEGHKLMMKLCKPTTAWNKWKAKPLEKDGTLKPEPTKYAGTKEEFLRELAYCRDDVDTERSIARIMPDLNANEWQVWKLDQTMNERGIYCDLTMADHILVMIEKYKERQRMQLSALTDGMVDKETKRNAIKEWFLLQDYPIADTTSDRLRDIAEEFPDEPIGQVAALCRELNKSSTSKYKAMLDRASESDHRIRDTLMYHGAGTGRWSGRGVQLQNLVSGNIKDMEKAVDDIMRQNISHVIAEHDSPMELFAGLVRGAICAPEGKELIVADYAAIEGRGVMWLADERKGLEIFYRDEDIYCDMATDIYGRPVIANPDKQPPERKLGKQAVLGLGYQMGPSKFLVTCEKYRIFFTDDLIDEVVPREIQQEIEDDIRSNPIIYFSGNKGRIIEAKVRPLIFSKHVVNKYRARYPAIPQYWADCEKAAKEAIDNYYGGRSDKWVRAGHKRAYGNVYYKVHGKFLFCRLPSGRHLAYPFPRIEEKDTAWGTSKDTIMYDGVDSFTHQWTAQSTYGGKLVENITQAVSRDIMAEALLRLEGHEDYTPVLSVHDEAINEVDEGKGFTEEVEWIMEQRPSWAPTFPIAVEGWRGKRYRK